MAYDEGLSEIMRGDLIDLDGVEEKRMFGGLAFMVRGHMLCGVHAGGGIFRVGKENEPQALEIDGVRPMTFTGRRMGGFVEVDDDVIADDARRGRLLALGLGFVSGLPAK